MLILRQVIMNLIEPAVLSMRVPKDMAVELDLEFIKADGAPLAYDPMAKLDLTSRTAGQHLEYDVISTDVSNGKGTATIPAETLKDINGYQVRLTGTIDGRDTLVGMGNVRLIDT